MCESVRNRYSTSCKSSLITNSAPQGLFSVLYEIYWGHGRKSQGWRGWRHSWLPTIYYFISLLSIWLTSRSENFFGHTGTTNITFIWAKWLDWQRINGSMHVGEVGRECRRGRCIDFFPLPQYNNSTDQEITSFYDPKCLLLSASGYAVRINPLNTKRRLLYLKTQFVSRSKHFSSRL